jgi:hypothetical protein
LKFLHLRGAGSQPGYKARKEVDKVSYEWNALIRLFTASILRGEVEGAFGTEPDPSKAEQGLRSGPLETHRLGRASRRIGPFGPRTVCGPTQSRPDRL